MEGILPYLTGDAQDTLFARITELSAPGSRLGIGALGSCLDQDRLAALEVSYPGLNLSGDVNFSTLTYDDATKTKPAQWLADHGWTVDPVQTNPGLQREYGRTRPRSTWTSTRSCTPSTSPPRVNRHDVGGPPAHPLP